ncbi:ArsR family transcriptional regulator [Halorubrum ejinorense]|uniref:ArsR family transcriptional regulator n=1 Tax=Halorubrum ejinorense TaxID=425309 RepID=A0AAV3SMW9_9EURY
MVGTHPDSQAFTALANPYRRQLLFALYDANPQDDDYLDPLDLLVEGETTDDRAATRIELRHAHLPKLADMGFIEWERESGGLSKGPSWEEVVPLLQLIYEHRDELPDEWVSGLPMEA